ncbi:MAG: hypothetical protein K2Y28_17950 [Burkholderiaceae bacterium]|nr:hypothetical protein [Burkholderiaceae bacterium]
MTMTYSSVEREIIGLCICLEAIGDIANHALFTLRDVSGYPEEVEALFHSHIHRDLFLIRLLDFAKEKGDTNLTGVPGSCISVLKAICETKHFEINGSVAELKSAIEALEAWLQHKQEIMLWLPTLETEAKLFVSRLEFLSIVGNHSKHNLSRLTGVSRDIAKILNDHGYKVLEEQIPLALDDFREHLSGNYFIYYGTWLCELLNDIRWGMQSYLQPVFLRSYAVISNDTGHCRYEYPPNIQTDISRQWYRRLMNNVRTKPYLKRFKGSRHLKGESSFENNK